MLALTLVCLREWAGFLQLSVAQTRVFLAVSAVTGVGLLYLLHQFGFHWFFLSRVASVCCGQCVLAIGRACCAVF